MWTSGGESLDLDSEELSLIDCGIATLWNVPLKPHLLSLNLHCNRIGRIEGLDCLANLRHLDLSSNQIQRIEGLDSLVSLRTLNLSCNLIECVSGLGNLRSLVKLNLSYNQVKDLSALNVFHHGEYKLTDVSLHGNKIASTQHVVNSLVDCANLRHMTLAQGGADNPLCQTSGYQRMVLAGLPQVTVLDRVDRDGCTVAVDNILSDIPGLDNYMEYLLSNSSLEVNPVAVDTPKIDAALQLYKQRGVTPTESNYKQRVVTPTESNSTPVGTGPDSSTPANDDVSKDLGHFSVAQEARLAKLEELLKLLPLQAGGERKDMFQPEPSSDSPRVTKHRARRDIDEMDESEGERSSSCPRSSGTKRSGRSQTPTRKKNRSRFPSKQTKAHPSVNKTKTRQVNSSNTTTTPEDSLHIRGQSFHDPGKTQDHHTQGTKDPHHTGRTMMSVKRYGPGAVAADERLRDDIHTNYVQLTQELETERERRWKAEQAARKLTDHIRELQGKANEDSELHGATEQVTGRLKQALALEHEARQRLQEEVISLKEHNATLAASVETSNQKEADTRAALQASHETITKMEHDHVELMAAEVKKQQDLQMRASASTRELHLVKNASRSLKGQLHQLQELLVSKEQEHRKALGERFARGSPEMLSAVREEVERVEQGHERQLEEQKRKVDSLMKQYGDLEDEFRLALHIEASRFNELQEAYQKTSHENAESKKLLTSAQSRDDKMSGLVAELTAMVKEQKGRITELSKSKQEMTQHFKERVTTLESHVTEARRRMLSLELLKKDKSRLEAEVQAMESIVEGLKMERKLWGEELAQQGASLSQDRGRLESRIEILSGEVSSLKKHLQSETDAVRIKTKMIEDQTETIRKLKEEVRRKDGEMQQVGTERLSAQRDLEVQLSTERSLNTDLQEKQDRLRDRKDELKQQVAELEEQLDQSKMAHSVLNQKWKDKSSLIGQLEKQVTQMKDFWLSKEVKLVEERDKAIGEARESIHRLRSVDDAFRQQLDMKEENHRLEIAEIIRKNQHDVDTANKHVEDVEEEMRMLLRETDSSRRLTEEKLKKLSRAFIDLQSDVC